MFETMRRNTKLIMWITTASFVLLIFIGWGMEYSGFGGKKGPRAGDIGSVNGEPIRATVYQEQINQLRANMQSQGQPIDEATDVQIRDQAWNTMVQQALIGQEIRRRNITISDKEIVEAIRTQPIPQIMQNPEMQTNGQFDYNKYLAALADPNRDWTGLENYYRADLPAMKMQSIVMSSVKVTDADVRRQFDQDNAKAKVAYAFVPASNFKVDPQSIDDSTLRSYYEAHKDDYRSDTQASVQYVRIEKKPTMADSSAARDLITQASKEAQSGEDFATLVSAYSEAPTQLRGGATGIYVTEDQLNAPVLRAAAFSLPVGQISDIIPDQGGYHLIRVEDRRANGDRQEAKIADIYIPISLSSETLTGYRDKAEAVMNAAKEEQGNLTLAAQKEGFTTSDAGPFGRKSFVPRLGQISGFMDWAFNAATGKISAFEGADGWYVMRLAGHRPAGIPPLDEIKDRVRNDAALSMQSDQAKQAAEPILSSARAGTPLEQAAGTVTGATFGSTDEITRKSYARDIGSDPAVMSRVFSDPLGIIPSVIATKRGAFVVQILSRTEPDESQFASQKDQIRKQLAQRRKSEIVGRWMEELRAKAKIEDYRSDNGI
jgi:peptidyl-prolyl cis-trans isomerase D